MKLKLLLIIFVLAGCQQQRSPKLSSDSYTIDTSPVKQEVDNKIIYPDTLGAITGKIKFKVKADKEDLDIFTNGIVPWVSLNEPAKQLNKLMDANQVVLPPLKSATVMIDYPLKHETTLNLPASKTGYTRAQLIELISKKYHEIYTEEEASANIKTIPIGQRKGLINRNETDGKYGIWGHDLSDLDLESIEVHQRADGKIFLVLDIDS